MLTRAQREATTIENVYYQTITPDIKEKTLQDKDWVKGGQGVIDPKVTTKELTPWVVGVSNTHMKDTR